MLFALFCYSVASTPPPPLLVADPIADGAFYDSTLLEVFK